jgi:MFS family permease
MTVAAAVDPVEPSQVSYRTAWAHPQVRVLSVSRAAAKMGISTVSYGVMVFLARQDASQFQISLVSASVYVAALLFGLQGGILADKLSKQVALVFAFSAQAALCFLTPALLGTSVGDLLFLAFVLSALGQLVLPGLKAMVAIVSTPAELATTGALVSVVGSVASAIGSSIVAPMMIKLSGIELTLYVAGVLFALGAIRAYRLPKAVEGRPTREVLREMDWKPRALSLRRTADWIMAHRPVASMMLVGIMVTALYEGFNTLLPRYVRDVLEEDPANSIYIFAPAGIGFLIGAIFSPWFIEKVGERRLATASFVLISVGLILFGLIDQVAGFFAPFNPLRLLGIFGIELSDRVLAAGVIAIPANFGSTAAGAAVQAYLNRWVPVVSQGATFGLQEVQKNALNIVTIVGLGAVASLTGPRFVFVVAPLVVAAPIVWLLRYSYRRESVPAPSARPALGFFRDAAASDAPTGGSAGDPRPGEPR